MLSLLLVLLVGCSSLERRPSKYSGLSIIDAGGRGVSRLQTGSSLQVAAGNLEPFRVYEFRLAIGEWPALNAIEAVSFARLTADAAGQISPFHLWYHSGVVGCSLRVSPEQELPRFTYRTFDDAERDLAGQHVTVSVHPVQHDRTGTLAPMELGVGGALRTTSIPIVPATSPMVYPSDAEGCLLNSASAGAQDMYVSGRNFAPHELVQLSVVENQRRWRVNDVVSDITGVGGAAAPMRVESDENGRFTVRVWHSGLQRRGVYDIIAHRRWDRGKALPRVRASDIVSYAADTGYILYLRYPVGGPTMDLAGRPLSGFPYFQFADSFAETDDTVWGAVDPTYVPDSHPGGKYGAYYVVDHRDVNGWDPTAGGSIMLTDVSGGIEIMRVKSGCINGTDTPIWHPPLTLGDYDVVVDFGPMPAETAATYTTDFEYNEAVDFLDGADQIGFVVARDPYELGPVPIGRAEYSQDDFFGTLGTASNVDLRAIVRYPAVTAGDDTQVAFGQHPLFLIQHGNHKVCEVGGHSHASCPDRTPNHEGYMRLLEILASHGIIAVSIDAYDLTGSWSMGVQGWIEERGDLILKHIELWSHMNDTATFTSYADFFSGRFANKVDLTRISVSGHSRGGEASVAAYMRNTSFNVGSVSSIAPVDFESYVLPDVPYFVILPAADGDVSNLNGIAIYDRAGSGLTPVDSTTKSGIYVYGANHNFFNTVWADDNDDYEDYVLASPQRDDYIPKAQQQRLGEAYLAAFARIHLLGETVYEDMLRGKLIFPSTAGFKNFPVRHEKSNTKVESGTGGTAAANNATATSVSGPSVQQTQALQVTWSSSSGELVYTLPAGPWNASSFEVLSFRVAQTNSLDNPASGDQDYRVELAGGGKTKATYASRFGRIPKPYSHGYGPRNVMTTIRIPLHSFIINKSGVTLDNIDTIRFRFTSPSQGEIYVDDIEFSR